jgi:hypothetical protein
MLKGLHLEVLTIGAAISRCVPTASRAQYEKRPDCERCTVVL